MFGYICINDQELRRKDYDLYHSYYCGLCRALQNRYGRNAGLLLNYDMTFLAILLTGLYEPEETERTARCVVHPVSSHREMNGAALDYAADMTILLAYQKALDDWRDEHSRRARVLAMLLYKDYCRLRREYPRQAKTLEKCVRELSAAEKAENDDPDYVAGLTGRFLAELFVWKEDIWQEDLRQTGFYLGKFVYLMDAWDDMEKDRKKNNYNLMLCLEKKAPETFAEEAKEMMVDVMSGCARAFERLPILERSEILRNILYSGVWVRYAKGSEAAAEENNEKSI